MYKYLFNYYSRYYKHFTLTIKNIFNEKSDGQILGRWCHVSLPKCCNNVIEKKIDFANRDNSFSYNKNNN